MSNTKEILTELHHKLAEHMLVQLQEGNPAAKDLAVMVKFLKDNNVELDTLNGVSSDAAFNALIEEAAKHLETIKH